MILRRLRMENIRSYRQVEVEFPRGRTLFEGDIGAGKSTILMAIEFALFGLGRTKASSLLRVGESKGSVELEFEAGGREYWVRRTLVKKGGSVQQAEGKLRGADGEEDYPASEMKEKILGILNYREPTDPRSKSLIYQYAVYTPQEEMKQIISMPSDQRIQILRRAFGVEEYKTAMENARELLARVREKRGLFEVASKGIESLKAERAEQEERVGRGEAELAKLEDQEKEEEKRLTSLEGDREELYEVGIRLARAQPERVNLERQIEADKEEAEELSEEARRLEARATEVEARIQALASPPCDESQDELRMALRRLSSDIDRHKEAAAAITTKMGQYEAVAKDRWCPVCDREADAQEFGEKIGRLSDEQRSGAAHLERLGKERDSLEATLEKRIFFDALAERGREDRATLEEYRRDQEKRRRRLAAALGRMGENPRKLTELEGRIRVLQKEAENLEPLQRRIEAAQRELRRIREGITGTRSDLRNWRTEIKRLGEEVVLKERAASKATQLGDRQIWLEEYFIPTLESIETHVMTSINREFDHSFRRWFSLLVEDGGKESRVDEEFSPQVEEDGYEQDVEFLSGGERTSVALAYRLALSQMVQRFAEAGPSSLILDEPTDGFSKEQLGKMREILDEMANPQVIIVSHERELESFADQIYRVAKVQGESKISA